MVSLYIQTSLKVELDFGTVVGLHFMIASRSELIKILLLRP